MADKNFGQFTNQTSPATGDFVVGYRGTNEQRYTLHSISGLIVGEGGDGQGLTSAKNLGAAPSIGVLSGVAGTTGVWLKSLSGKGNVSLTENDSTIFISGTAGGSSLWSENGTKIYYNTDNVGIGTTDPSSKLEVRGDLLVKTVGEDQIALYMNNPDGNFGFVSQSGKYNQVFSSGPVKYSADTDTFLSVSGDRITIGNQQNASLTEARKAPVGFNIIPTDAASLTTVNLISTGISFAGGNKDNLLNFIEREPLAGGIENKWTIGQVVTGLQSQPLDSGSYLVIGHNTGESRVNLTGSDAIMTLTPDGKVGIGTNTPSAELEIRGDTLVKTVGEDQIALYMNNPEGNFGFVSQSGKYNQVFSSGPVKYSADTDTFLSVSGDRITIGNQQNASLTEALNAPIGFNIIPTDAASLTTVNLISTGINFAGGNKDNLLNFVEQEYNQGSTSYNKTRWTLGQVVTGLQSQPFDTGSYLVIGYKTGEGEMSLTGSDAVMTFTPDAKVGIGTNTPDALLHLSGDQYQLHISGPDGENKYIKINSSAGENFIGYNETVNGLLVSAEDNAPLFLGQVTHQAIRVDKNGDRGSVVIGDDISRPSAGDEVLTVRNTGSSAGPTMTLQNNTAFGGDLGIRYEHVGIGGNSWMQGRYDSDSSFRLAFTGGQDAVLGTNDLFVLTTGGNLTIGAESASNDFIVSGSKVGIGLGTLLPEYNLHVSGTENSLVAKFEGDVVVGGDSANNASLVINHTGSIGSANNPTWQNAAIMVSGNPNPADPDHDDLLLAIDNNQIIFSGGGASGPYEGSMLNTYGPLNLGGSLTYSPYTAHNNIRIADNGVNLGSATSFSGSHTLHVSGGRSANSVIAKFEGDVYVGGDSANNATLVVDHTGTIGNANYPKWENSAILISGSTTSAASGARLGIDNNQIMFSGGFVDGVGPYNCSVFNTAGALDFGATSYAAPYTKHTNIRIRDNGIMMGAAAAFSGSYPVHISGGRAAGGVKLRAEGDISISDSLKVGSGNAVPYGSAIIDCESTNKAFLPPRMTTAQRNAISSPIAGMVIYNTDDNVLNFHNGTTWGAV